MDTINPTNNNQPEIDDKKIEFAQKLGEDLNKKEPSPISLGGQEKTDDIEEVEDIYDIDKDVDDKAKEQKKEGLNGVDSSDKNGDGIDMQETIVAKSGISMSVSDIWKKIKSKFFEKKEADKGILELNLVKEEIVKYFDWQSGILTVLLACFFSLSFLSISYWAISWWMNKEQVAVNSPYVQEYLKVNREIKDLSPQVDEVLVFKKQLDISNALLDKHTYWTNFFDFLEDNTLSDVYFSSFSGDISGMYQFNATSKSIDAINAQIKKLLDNPYIKEAQVDSTSVGSGANGSTVTSFSLVFSLDPKIFLKKAVAAPEK